MWHSCLAIQPPCIATQPKRTAVLEVSIQRPTHGTSQPCFHQTCVAPGGGPQDETAWSRAALCTEPLVHYVQLCASPGPITITLIQSCVQATHCSSRMPKAPLSAVVTLEASGHTFLMPIFVHIEHVLSQSIPKLYWHQAATVQ